MKAEAAWEGNLGVRGPGGIRKLGEECAGRTARLWTLWSPAQMLLVERLVGAAGRLALGGCLTEAGSLFPSSIWKQCFSLDLGWDLGMDRARLLSGA